MITRFRSILLAASALVACNAMAVPLVPVTINFDDQPGGVPALPTTGVFNPHATFTTQAGATLRSFPAPTSSVARRRTCSARPLMRPRARIDGDIYVDFSVPVQGLTLKVLADNDAGTIANLKVFHGSALSTTLGVAGDANLATPIAIDLSAYAGVTRIELYGIGDQFGLGIDDLAFSVPVPELPTPLFIGAGLLALAALRRRRVPA